MKYNGKNFLAGLLVAVAFALCGSIACSQNGGVKEQRAQQEKIAAACKGITVAMNGIALNVEQAPPGAAKAKAKALAANALVVARPTKDFCQPKPATYLNPTDFAALLTAAADLATKKESVP